MASELQRAEFFKSSTNLRDKKVKEKQYQQNRWYPLHFLAHFKFYQQGSVNKRFSKLWIRRSKWKLMFHYRICFDFDWDKLINDSVFRTKRNSILCIRCRFEKKSIKKPVEDFNFPYLLARFALVYKSMYHSC